MNFGQIAFETFQKIKKEKNLNFSDIVMDPKNLADIIIFLMRRAYSQGYNDAIKNLSN